MKKYKKLNASLKNKIYHKIYNFRPTSRNANLNFVE